MLFKTFFNGPEYKLAELDTLYEARIGQPLFINDTEYHIASWPQDTIKDNTTIFRTFDVLPGKYVPDWSKEQSINS
jgi:hypothetical protein